MNFFIRTLLLSLSVFLFHILIFLLVPGNAENSGYYGTIGAVIFYFAFGYWGYFILSGIYIYISKRDSERTSRYIKGSFIILIGYTIFRVPDIIDNDFFRNFDIIALLIFLISIPILVELEDLLKKKIK